jgi:DNA ligase (NAD+)
VEAIESAKNLSTDELVAFLTEANIAYRNGNPLIDDAIYDHVYLAELFSRTPDHPFLKNVEPESDFGTGKVKHDSPLLSTDKAYTVEDIKAFVKRIETTAIDLKVNPSSLLYRLTPKLDGMAGSYTCSQLVTRGNGDVGSDVTHIFDRGVVPIGGMDTGLGEIVLSKAYWNRKLSDRFSHPRNVVVGLVGADNLNEDTAQALSDRAVHFVPYSQLSSATVSGIELVNRLELICKELEDGCDYPTDGSVIEVTDAKVKVQLGHTSHHYRWQIAKKTVGETAVSTVKAVNWQTGRTGRVTPIISIERTWLSGAWIENVTGHHAGNIRNLQIGVGCKISLVRSGEVIPKLLGITKQGSSADIPSNCPSCNYDLEWERDFIICGNSLCTAQIANRLSHFFSTIGNIDLFGEKTIATLLNHGVDELPTIYALNIKDFESMGFGPKQAQNLVRELKRSLSERIEDWRFLASFGIRHLGRGDSRRLLNKFKLSELPQVDAEQIQALDSFGPLKAPRIASELKSTWPLIAAMIKLGFKLDASRKTSAPVSAITGLNIVFTGKMENSRKLLQDQALQFGANSQSSVTGNTNILVIGENVGSKKIEAAKKHSTRIISEAEYIELIASCSNDETTNIEIAEKSTRIAAKDQMQLFA